jgi:hypothetical protein
MNTADAIAHFGGIAPLAKALGVKTQAISQWKEKVPELRSYQIEVLTCGQLKAEPTASAQTDSSRVTQRVDAATSPQNFPSVKRAIATATALSNSTPPHPTPCV